ncbi:hypothetical protein [Embleya scabrispora]|uniref:hypothetical protein n=1 Tax=Embleya scabrispora TaxID=159449 RepID=UPI000361B3CF|nr:hypothetical protein [Embleya scabrispora]MYS81686.1 hypothetical protein [Streptomyces sp. SID5474]
MTAGPGDDARRQLLREYREFIRASHPDRGGDPEEFVAGLERYRALIDAAGPPAPVRSGAAAETTVYRRGRLPGRLWRQLTERHRRRQNPRVE